MRLWLKASTFEVAFADAKAACGDINSEASSELAKQINRYGAEVGMRNYLNPEGLALSIYEKHWRHVAIALPQELEKRLVSVLEPLSKEQEHNVREFLNGYFDRGKEQYLEGWKVRRRTKGKPDDTPSKTFLNAVESKVNGCRTRAQDALTRSIKTRRIVYRLQKRTQWINLMIGIIIGAIGSLLAQWIWKVFFD